MSRAERDEAIICDIWVAQNIVESGYLKIYDHDVAIKGNEKERLQRGYSSHVLMQLAHTGSESIHTV